MLTPGSQRGSMSYFLYADSDLAKEFQGPHGPDILIADETRLGRSVTGRDSCRLPNKWAQVSGTHCKIFYTSLKEPVGYWIEDTSTNGTVVNGERVAKHSAVPLSEGDKIQLSWTTDNKALLQYIFKKQTDGSAGLGKRQRSSSIPDDSPDGKRTRAAGDGDALLKSVAQLEQSNQDLRKRLDAERSQKEQYEKQLAAVREEVTAAAQSAQEDAEVAQQQAQAKADKAAETAKAAIEAAEQQASSNLSRAEEAEQKLASEGAALTDANAKLADLEAKHSSLQEQEAKLSTEVSSLNEEVASLKASLAKARQQATELDQRLGAQMEQARTTAEALEKQAESLQAEREAGSAAKDQAEQAVKAAADAKSAEEGQRTARQAADSQLATVKAQLEEAQRAQQRAQEQQHNAEEVLSVKLALLQSMAQRFAQAGEAKRKAAELQVKAQERIAQADEDMRALGQQLMYAAAGKLESNSEGRTAFQGETSGGAAPTQGQGQAGADANRPDNETAVQQAGTAPDDTAAQPHNSPTLQLQLIRSHTQHTVQGGLPVIEDTQENLPEPTAAPEDAAEGEVAVTAEAQRSASASASGATSASTSPSVHSSSKDSGGNENVNNNSMDVDTANTAEAAQKPDRASAVKSRSSADQAVGVSTTANNASFALQLPETAVYGQGTANNTLDEFDGME